MATQLNIDNSLIIMKKDYKTLSFLLRGKRRRVILLALKEPKTPKEVAQECKISISNVSNSLAELMKAEYVMCKTPEAHTYRYFALTKKGRQAISLLKAEKNK